MSVKSDVGGFRRRESHGRGALGKQSKPTPAEECAHHVQKPGSQPRSTRLIYIHVRSEHLGLMTAERKFHTQLIESTSTAKGWV